MMPKVDTFEGNISDEIRRKEASLAEISAASNNVGNDPNDDVELPKKTPVFFVTLVGSIILCILGVIGLVFYYYSTQKKAALSQAVITTTTKTKPAPDIKTISPTLSSEIGRFVTHVEKKDQGYIITISDYPPVFAYMTRNEKNYIEELALLVSGISANSSSTTPVEKESPKQIMPQTVSPVVSSSTSLVTSSSQKITSTSSPTILGTTTLKTNQRTSSSTKEQEALSSSPEQLIEVTKNNSSEPEFTDVTISNQNMRVWSSGETTVVYAFVGTNTVLISRSTDGILALRGAILR